MTDPFDFERRFEERLVAQAARADRPFDAVAIAAAAATVTRRSPVRPWAHMLSGSDGRLSPVRTIFVLLTLAVVVAAGTILVGAVLRGRTPLPDRLSVAPPTTTPSPTKDVGPTPVPSETPLATPVPTPGTAASSDRILYTDAGPNRCGTRVHSIDVLTGVTSPALPGCFLDVRVAPDGRHVVAGGGTGYDDNGDGVGIVDPADEHRFTIVDLSSGTGPRVDDTQMLRFGWSPDGRWITHDGLIAPADGSPWTALPAAIGTACAPCWSPDGSRLAVRTVDGMLIGDGGGANLRLVPKIPSIWSWSRNGARVAWVQDGDAWAGNVDASDVRNVMTFGQPGAASVAMSPNGATVAVHVGPRTIYMVYPDGSHAKVDLGPGLPGGEIRMDWSSTGRWLAVSAAPPEGPGTGTTLLMSSDGTVVARVAASHVSWAPDGSRLAVSVTPWDLDPQSTTAQAPKAEGTTYLLWLDGSFATIADAWSPVWSPDSRSLAILSGTPTSTRLQLVDVDGSQRRTITAVGSPGVGDVTWMR